jgi:hypothetical protein
MADPAYIVDGVLTDGEAWVGIAHASLSLPAATVTWTSTDDGQTGDFSQYMDLVIVSYTRSDAASAIRYLYMNFNNSSGDRHYVQWLWGDGANDYASATASSSSAQPIGVVLGGGAATNEFSSTVTHLFDINSGKYKSGVTMSGGDSDGDGEVIMNGVTWTDQAPITEIDLTTYTDDFVAGCTFSLFGVLPRMVA